MPKVITDSELDEVFDAVRAEVYGASTGRLLASERLSLTRRTLQRRLEELIEREKIEAIGEGRGRKYRVLAPKVEPSDRFVYDERSPEIMSAIRVSEPKENWLSLEAQDIREYVNLPASKREKVGYDPDFLESYEPNVTAYLPDEMRGKLVELGVVSEEELPAGTYLRQVMDRLIIDLSFHSSRLEGNTYSLLETQKLLEIGDGATDKTMRETLMILNHKAAIEMLSETADELAFNRYTVCNLHASLADNLIGNQAARGRIRNQPVGIGGSVYRPLCGEELIEEQFDRFLEKAEAIQNPFEQAFFSMVHLPYLQPFIDVNKRTSRLLANVPLVKNNLCPLSFLGVPREDYLQATLGVYETRRVDYLRDVFLWAYTRSAAKYSTIKSVVGDPDPFRLRHREEVVRFVRRVVKKGLDKSAAAHWIAEEAGDEIPSRDRGLFVEMVEQELMDLHIGSLRPYGIGPSHFEKWKKSWK